MSDTSSIQVSSLVIDQPLPHDLTSQQGVLLLRAGVKITPEFLETLSRRGISQVDQRPSADAPPPPPPSPSLSSPPSSAVPTAIDSGSARPNTCPPTSEAQLIARQKRSGESSSGSAYPAGPSGFTGARPIGGRRTGGGGGVVSGRLSPANLTAMAAEAERAFDGAIGRYLELGPALLSGQAGDLGLAGQLVEGFGHYLDADPSVLMLLLRLKDDAAGGEDGLYRHGMKSALLSMTLIRQMGMPKKKMIDGGLASLVHDLGMMRVPEAVRETAGPLSVVQRRMIEEHPTHTLNLLDKLTGVDDSIKTAAYQVHERCDASGYPKRRPQQFIHPLAKVAAVADCYNALTSPRPHRPALSGHDAMKTILREVKAGRLERTVVRRCWTRCRCSRWA